MNSSKNSINVLLSQFKSYTNDTINLINCVRQGQLDSSATDRAFKLIEENAKLQILMLKQLKQLLDLGASPTKFDAEVSILDFKFPLIRISYSVHCLRGGRLDRSATIENFKIIEDKAKLQMSLLDKLLN